jgi:hypothetical protein
MREDAMSWKVAFLPVVGVGAMVTVGLAGPRQTVEKPEDAAQARAEAWLMLVDQANYGQSWDEAASLLKKAVTKDQWSATARAAREPLGKLVSRKLKSRAYTKTLPGAPDGEYVVIQYDSSFQNKKEAAETIIPMKDADGAWRVSGYFFK